MRTLLVALVVALGTVSIPAQAGERSMTQLLGDPALEPLRSAERAESFAVEEVHGRKPAHKPVVTDLQARFAVLPEALAVPDDVARELASLLLAPASYTQDRSGCRFAPGVALRFHKGGAALDVFVCFQCSELAFQRVGAPRAAGRLHFGPAERALLDLVRRARPADARLEAVEKEWAAQKEQARAMRAAKQRWVQAMPEPIRPLWQDPSAQFLTYLPSSSKEQAQVKFVDADVEPLRAALARAVPDPTARIRALYQWYGSGAGPWSGYPSYEDAATKLLLAYSTRELVAAAVAGPLTPEQTEGAARLFAGWEFRRARPNDAKLLPAELRAALLARGQASPDADKRARAEAAFKPR